MRPSVRATTGSRPAVAGTAARAIPRVARVARRCAGTAALAALALDVAGAQPSGPPWLLGFDDVPAGTVLNEAYAARGVHLRSFGDGLLGEVIADTACVQAASVPNVLSPNPVGACPAYRDNLGWIRVTFDIAQPRVSVSLTNAGDGVASYLKAYKGAALLEMVFGQTGPAWNGVPQTLEVQRPAGHPLIDYVEVGAFRDSDLVEVDDLSYDLRPVPVQQRSWGFVKARYP